MPEGLCYSLLKKWGTKLDKYAGCHHQIHQLCRLVREPQKRTQLCESSQCHNPANITISLLRGERAISRDYCIMLNLPEVNAHPCGVVQKVSIFRMF